MIAQQAADQRSVHRVSGAVGHHAPQHLVANQREIADQVQHLVPHKLVGETQRPVLDPFPGEHDGVLFAGAADQSHVAQSLRLMQESEGARRGNVARIIAAR